VSPDVRIDSAQIRDVLVSEVIKREVMEGERAEEARKKISRAANNALRATSAKVKQADQSKDSDEVPA
jgi:hypothetical protein